MFEDREGWINFVIWALSFGFYDFGPPIPDTTFSKKPFESDIGPISKPLTRSLPSAPSHVPSNLYLLASKCFPSAPRPLTLSATSSSPLPMILFHISRFCRSWNQRAFLRHPRSATFGSRSSLDGPSAGAWLLFA